MLAERGQKFPSNFKYMEAHYGFWLGKCLYFPKILDETKIDKRTGQIKEWVYSSNEVENEKYKKNAAGRKSFIEQQSRRGTVANVETTFKKNMNNLSFHIYTSGSADKIQISDGWGECLYPKSFLIFEFKPVLLYGDFQPRNFAQPVTIVYRPPKDYMGVKLYNKTGIMGWEPTMDLEFQKLKNPVISVSVDNLELIAKFKQKFQNDLGKRKRQEKAQIKQLELQFDQSQAQCSTSKKMKRPSPKQTTFTPINNACYDNQYLKHGGFHVPSSTRDPESNNFNEPWVPDEIAKKVQEIENLRKQVVDWMKRDRHYQDKDYDYLKRDIGLGEPNLNEPYLKKSFQQAVDPNDIIDTEKDTRMVEHYYPTDNRSENRLENPPLVEQHPMGCQPLRANKPARDMRFENLDPEHQSYVKKYYQIDVKEHQQQQRIEHQQQQRIERVRRDYEQTIRVKVDGGASGSKINSQAPETPRFEFKDPLENSFNSQPSFNSTFSTNSTSSSPLSSNNNSRKRSASGKGNSFDQRERERETRDGISGEDALHDFVSKIDLNMYLGSSDISNLQFMPEYEQQMHDLMSSEQSEFDRLIDQNSTSVSRNGCREMDVSEQPPPSNRPSSSNRSSSNNNNNDENPVAQVTSTEHKHVNETQGPDLDDEDDL